MTNELDEIFANYDERKREEGAADAAEQKHEDSEHSGAISTLENLVVPVLREMSEALKSHGHESGFSAPDPSDFPPTASLTFGVVRDDIWSHAAASKIEFSCSDLKGRILVHSYVRFSGGSYTHSAPFDTPGKNIEERTPEWVRSQVLAFVRVVLDAH